jgi:hypothetical protein
MADGASVINLGDLSKPATVLIQKISDALGGYFKPYQMKRIAKAETEVKVIETQAQIKITDLQRRAFTRWIAEESRKQQNIEAITSKSIPHLTNSSNPQNMDDDWIANFFEKCRIVSDEQMQLLWGKILAGEANVPGSFSKRTINLLGSVEKNEAQLFTILCGFSCVIANVSELLVDDVLASIYNNRGVNFETLTHLDDIGLINFDPLAGFARNGLPQEIDVAYHGNMFRVSLKTLDSTDNTKYQMQIGKTLFTHAGSELAKICDPAPMDGFLDYVADKLRQEGATVSLPP